MSRSWSAIITHSHGHLVCYSRLVQRAGEPARNARHHFNSGNICVAVGSGTLDPAQQIAQRPGSRSTFPSDPSSYPRVQVSPPAVPGPSRTAGRRSRSAPTRKPRSLLRVRRVASRLAPKVQTPTLPQVHSNLARGLAEPRPLRLPLAPRNSARRRHQSPPHRAVRSRRSSSPR